MLIGPARAGERMEKNEIAHLKCLHYVIVSFLGGTLILGA
jgi:hypothetical protein